MICVQISVENVQSSRIAKYRRQCVKKQQKERHVGCGSDAITKPGMYRRKKTVHYKQKSE